MATFRLCLSKGNKTKTRERWNNKIVMTDVKESYLEEMLKKERKENNWYLKQGGRLKWRHV